MDHVSLRKRFVFTIHLYTFAFHYALRSTLRDYIDIRFNTLENTLVANHIQTRFIWFFIVQHTMEEMLTFRILLSRRFIIRELIMCSCCRYIDITRQNTGRAGGNLQNLSHQRANRRRWRDSADSPIHGDCFVAKAHVAKSYVIFESPY